MAGSRKRKADPNMQGRTTKKKLTLEKDKERKAISRSKESSKQKRSRLESDRKRKSTQRSNMSDEAASKRKKVEKERLIESRKNESEVQTDQRLKKNRIRMRQKRSKKAMFKGANAQDETSPLLIGQPSIPCIHCGALLFASERGRVEHACCHKGKIKLNPLPEFPITLKSLLCENTEQAKHFRQNIRYYNNAFAMASFCPTEDATLPGVGCVKIRGAVNVRATTSLTPTLGKKPCLGQIYIYDNEEAILFRSSDNCRSGIIQTIQEIMNNNSYGKMYKSLFTQYKENNYHPNVNIRFLRLNGDDRRRYNHPTSGNTEIAAIILTGKEGFIPTTIDFKVYPKHEFQSKIMHKLSPHNEPMVFPLLFPQGSHGYSKDLLNTEGRKITPVQYFGQRLAINPNNFNPILYAGRLTQQYIIYAYIVAEWDRLQFIRLNQHCLRRETYQGLADHVADSSANTSNRVRLGNAVILPSTYDGSPRAMQQLYQDSMAIARELGRPDLFITFTTNPQWPEILEYLTTMPAKTTTSDIVYFVVRVFNIRLSKFIEDIYSGKVFGSVLAYVYTIEYQKRALPHAHCIFTLNPSNKLLTPEALDQFIKAEIPDKEEYQELYKKVMKHMLHGPHTDKTPCWDKTTNICSKKFPKEFVSETDMTNDAFPKYKRRDNRKELHAYNSRINGKIVNVANSMVVPYNPYLLLKYDCHINTEYCGSLMAYKYIHKYITKGHDRIKVSICDNNVQQNTDEIADFIDSRYLSSMEAAWRLQELPMHGHSHSVIRLPVHLPNQQLITFQEGHESEAIETNQSITKLTAYFTLNKMNLNAKNFLYHEIPKHYVWDDALKQWKPRQRKRRLVVRMYSVSPKDSERFYLKILLRNVKGAEKFEHLKTFNGIQYETFEQCAYARGFGAKTDDIEEIMNEAASVMMPKNLRCFFAYILLTCERIDGKFFWEKYKNELCGNKNESLALSEIDFKLNGEDKSLNDFGINIEFNKHDPFTDEISESDHRKIATEMFDNLNEEQQTIFTEFNKDMATENNTNKLYFINAPGGTGKTYLYTSIYHAQRHKGKKIICIAWTGIAAILLPNGKTAHRAFKLPIQLHFEDTEINPIHLNKITKQILTEADIIIWDEASMIPAAALFYIHRILQDVMNNEQPFGGKYMLLGGDFRQVLPVIKKASRYQIVQATLINSPFWKLFKIFHLTKNMRSQNEKFSEWLLTIGNGDSELVEIPNEMLVTTSIVQDLYAEDYSEKSIRSTVLLAARNTEVEKLNEEVLKSLPGEDVICEGHSWATSIDGDHTDNDTLALQYQPELLSSLCPSGMPKQRLTLKIGAIVMLIRNLCIKDGLCNGTRLVILKIEKSVIYCSILTGDKAGTIIPLPKVTINTKEDKQLPFVLNRKQFPIRLAFAMTINKSQGQTFDKVGLYIDQNNPLFGHGQLYVALSRCKTSDGLKIKLDNATTKEQENTIKNIVYQEVLIKQ